MTPLYLSCFTHSLCYSFCIAYHFTISSGVMSYISFLAFLCFTFIYTVIFFLLLYSRLWKIAAYYLKNRCCKQGRLVWPCCFCFSQTAPLSGPLAPKHPIYLFCVMFFLFWILSFSNTLTKLSSRSDVIRTDRNPLTFFNLVKWYQISVQVQISAETLEQKDGTINMVWHWS